MAKLTKVACLYRVSTKKQVEENDIPMQKNACNTFIASMPGWVLTQEYYDDGAPYGQIPKMPAKTLLSGIAEYRILKVRLDFLTVL